MGVFDIGGGSNAWNYSDDSKDNYSQQLAGTVVEIAYVQARDFQTKQPVFWDDGNPKCNFRITVADANCNEFAWFISSSSKSPAMVAVLDAINPNRKPGESVDITQILGKMVVIATKPGSYNSQRPRPWWFQIHGDGDASLVRGCVDEVHKAKPASVQNAQFDATANGANAAMEAMGANAPAPAGPAPAGPAPVQQVGPGVSVPVDVYGEDIPF